VPRSNATQHIKDGIYLADRVHGEFAGYSASIVNNKSIAYIKRLEKEHPVRCPPRS